MVTIAACTAAAALERYRYGIGSKVDMRVVRSGGFREQGVPSGTGMGAGQVMLRPLQVAAMVQGSVDCWQGVLRLRGRPAELQH